MESADATASTSGYQVPQSASKKKKRCVSFSDSELLSNFNLHNYSLGDIANEDKPSVNFKKNHAMLEQFNQSKKQATQNEKFDIRTIRTGPIFNICNHLWADATFCRGKPNLSRAGFGEKMYIKIPVRLVLGCLGYDCATRDGGIFATSFFRSLALCSGLTKDDKREVYLSSIFLTYIFSENYVIFFSVVNLL